MQARAAALHLVRTDPVSAFAARRALLTARVPGLVHAQPVATATLTLPTPWRWGVLCAWEDLDAVRSLQLGRLELAPSLTLIPRQARGTWRGVSFAVQGGGAADEPIASFVYGHLRGRHAPEFFRRNVAVAAAARRSGGLEQGLGLFESPLRFASFSVWGSAADVRAFAYHPGAHRDVVNPYKAVPWADEHAAVRFGVVEDR